MKIENLLNNKDNSPQKPQIPLDHPDSKQNLEILDNYKNMQKVWSESLNNNLQAQIPQIAPPPNNFKDDLHIYDLLSPGTSKLKKILMSNKSPEPMNLTNYRRHSVDAMESPGALVGDNDKNFESSSCDKMPAEAESAISHQPTPEKISQNSTLPGNVSLSSLSGNSSYTPEQSPEKQALKIISSPADEVTDYSIARNSHESLPKANESVIENLQLPRELFPDMSNKNSLPGSLSSKNPQLSGILSSGPIKSTATSSQAAPSPNITTLLANPRKSTSATSVAPTTLDLLAETLTRKSNLLNAAAIPQEQPMPMPPLPLMDYLPPVYPQNLTVPQNRFVQEPVNPIVCNQENLGFLAASMPAQEMFSHKSSANILTPSPGQNRLITEKVNVTVPHKSMSTFLSPGLGATMTTIRNNGNQSNFEKPTKFPVSPIPQKTAKKQQLQLQQQIQQEKEKEKDNEKKKKLFICTDCNNAFSILHLFNHMKEVHNKFSCLYCYGFFENVEKLEKHLTKKHNVKNVQFNDELALHKYLDSSLKISRDKDDASEHHNVISEPTGTVPALLQKKSFKAVCCNCGAMLDFNENIENHLCDGLSNKCIISNIISDNRAEEPMDLEEIHLNQQQINQTLGIDVSETSIFDSSEVLTTDDSNIVNKLNDTTSSSFLSGADLDFLKVAPGSLGFNGSVLKHMQHSVDNYLQQQQKSQNSSQISNHQEEWHVESEPAAEDKLIVPKLKVKIPKFYNFDAIESDEDSGDEESDLEENEESDLDEDEEQDEEDDEISKRKNELLEKMREIENKLAKKQHKKKKDKDKEKIEEPPVAPATSAPPTPSLGLKIKFKNIKSENIEAVVENILEEPIDSGFQENEPQENQFDFENDEEENQEQQETLEAEEKEIQEEEQESFEESAQHEVVPMDIEEPPFEQTPQPETKIEPEPVVPEPEIPEEPKPRVILVDNMEIVAAGEEAMTYPITLHESLDKIPMREFLKMCLKITFNYCLYCNHARKIVVNGKSLAIHFITTHRFQAHIDGIPAEELLPDTILSWLELHLKELDECYFNLDTYDNFDQDKTEGHITISHDKLYECFQCRFQTSIHKDLYLHNRKMHQKTLIVCLMCKINFCSYSELLCHICPGQPHKQQFLDYKFYCCLCNMDNIPSAFRLMVHLRKKHFACDVCLEKCNDQSKLSAHVWKHKLNHLCYRCGIYYRNKADIMKHLFWKHGTEGITCKKCLQKKWPHVYHFCIPPTTFSCEICNLQFSRAINLKVHSRLHENEEKYPCTEDNCEKKFISRKLLLKHVARHKISVPGVTGSPNKSNVIIPTTIPDSHCSRTLPIQFRDVTKKILPLPIEKAVEAPPEPEPQETLEKPVKKPKKNKHKRKQEESTADVSDIPEIPEMRLNLSESDSSDNEDDSDIKQAPMDIEENSNSKSMLNPLVECSRLSDSSDDENIENSVEKSKEDSQTLDNKLFDSNNQENCEQQKNETSKNLIDLQDPFAMKTLLKDNLKVESNDPVIAPKEESNTTNILDVFKKIFETIQTELSVTDKEDSELDSSKELLINFLKEIKNPENIKNIGENFKNFQKSQTDSSNESFKKFEMSLEVLSFVEDPEKSNSEIILESIKQITEEDSIKNMQESFKLLRKTELFETLVAKLKKEDSIAVKTLEEAIKKQTPKEEESSKNLEPIKNIWENFKNFQQQQQQLNTEKAPVNSNLLDSDTEESYAKEIIQKTVPHVVQSDHDYAIMWKSKKVEEQEAKEAAKKLSEKQPSPKKKKKHDSSSSSDSDSDSDSSSCSCGSNCSCSRSSSSSSGSSSDSDSSSDSSDDEKVKNKATPKKKKHHKEPDKDFPTKSNDAIDVVATDDLLVPPKNPDEVIYESDLETDETDTDEDFYDEHPQKKASQMLADKRNQLFLQTNGEFDGIIENSRPSTPSLPPEEVSLKKRLKIKKRKKDRKSSMSPMKKMHHTSTPIQSNLQQESEIRQLLQSHQHTQPVLPIIKELEQQKRLSIDTPQLSIKAPSSATSSRKNSESGDLGVKRSQRKRVPNKFYGYTSDDDNSASASMVAPNNPFKPIPPPQLTWRKEDLPSSKKEKTSAKKDIFSNKSNKNWSLMPYKPPLTQTQMQQLPPQLNNQDYIQQYLQDQNYPAPAVIEPLKIPNVPVHHIQPVAFHHQENNQSTDSSDEEPALQINERKRKQKTKNLVPLENPPPIPKLKLTIGNDNKIKRRNIKPGGPPNKKRKVAGPPKPKPTKKKQNTSLNDMSLYSSQRSAFDESFESNSSISLSQSLTMPSTSLMPPSQLLKSPIMESASVSTPSTSNDYYYNQSVSQKQMEVQEQISKQQKLEDAIQKTQQYYQQFNHQQIKPLNHPQREVKEGERLYCYCRSPYDESSEMIGCDGDSCQIEWFHFECVGILVAPKGKWYCPECQKMQQQNINYPAI